MRSIIFTRTHYQYRSAKGCHLYSTMYDHGNSQVTIKVKICYNQGNNSARSNDTETVTV